MRGFQFRYSDVLKAMEERRIIEFFSAIPREALRYARDNTTNRNLARFALDFNDNILLKFLYDNDAIDYTSRFEDGSTLLHLAARDLNLYAIKLLFVLGADVSITTNYGASSFAVSLCHAVLNFSVPKFFVANGQRLQNHNFKKYGGANAKLHLIPYEKHVLNVRKYVVTLLALKRRRITTMVHLDRFLMKELAWAIWSTRY
jgi:hypothetical protein